MGFVGSGRSAQSSGRDCQGRGSGEEEYLPRAFSLCRHCEELYLARMLDFSSRLRHKAGRSPFSRWARA